MAFVDNSSTFRTLQKLQLDDGGRAVYAPILSGIAADTPVRVWIAESGYQASALAASLYGYVGVPEEGVAIASGSVALIRIEGYRANVQASAAQLTGSIGAPLIWAGTSLHATATSTALGIPGGNVGEVGVIYEALNASTTGNVFLNGNYTTAGL